MTHTIEVRQHFAQAVAQLGERHAVVAAREIFNSLGVKIVDKGVSFNLALYDRLTQHKLAAPIEDSVVSINGVNGDALKRAAAAVMDELPFFGRLAPDAATRSLFLNVLETVPLPQQMALQLTVARDVRPEIFLHLVRTALVAIWLVNRPGQVSRYQLGTAASAGLLHDIGMLHVDPVLLRPSHQLNREQRRELYAHPLLSNALIERHHQYPRAVMRAVAEHQEHLDGSGYPRNLTGDAISVLGRVVCLAQVVAAMFAAGRSAPEMQLSVLLRLNSDRYDPMMSAQILSQVQPQRDVLSAAVVWLDEPVVLLNEIDAILAQLPLGLGTEHAVTPARRDGLSLVAEHGLQLRRALAGVGAAPAQLAQLGDAMDDESVQTELALLAREASWQLRTLGREARRRWRSEANAQYPAPMQQWLDRIDAGVAAIAVPLSGVRAEPGETMPSVLPVEDAPIA
ncbi:MAG: HD domain-containing phosphohydrolase [Burkholderiaceae bacterium]